MSDDLLSAFEDCLHDLETGVGLDDVLSRYPAELAAELRPMLAAAQFARLPADVQPRSEAEMASRGRFLALGRAARQNRKARPWAWLFGSTPAGVRRRSLVLQLASLVFIAGTLLGGFATVNAAGAAMPGDLLYGLKRTVEDAQLALAPEPAGRQELEAQFDARRLEEAQRLLATRRASAITFVGDVQVIEGERWVISGVPVHVSGSIGQGLGVGVRVRVTGRSDPAADAIVAERLDLMGVPTLVPTLAPATETARPTSTPTWTATRQPTETAEPTVTASPSASPRPPTATTTASPLAGGALPTATTDSSGPSPSNTPQPGGSGGQATHTPDPSSTDDDDDEDDDDEDDESGGSGPSASNTPRPSDDNSGSGGGGGDDDDDEPTKTPKP
jgi:hypothetical protein